MRIRAFLALGLLCVTACALLTPKFAKPTLTVVEVRMLGGNFLQQSFIATFRIDNPNDRALPVKELHAQLKVGGEPVASGVTNHAFVVPARGETQFDMTITANMVGGVFKLLNNVDRRTDTIEYELVGAAGIDLPFLRDLAFDQRGSFSLGGVASPH